jgi:hypothetical protein
MRQSSVRMLIKGALIAILVSMIFNLSAIPVGYAAATQIAVVAPTADITVPTQFNVDITVTDVTDLYTWQIKLYYDPAVLLWVNATFPPGHVFEGKPFFSYPPFNDTDAGGTYIEVVNSIQIELTGFSGSGILCRISFEAKSAGTSTLIFSRPLGAAGDTWLMNSTDAIIGIPSIVFTAVDGSVNVVGSDTRLPTSISSNIDRSTMVIGDVGEAGVVISGAINVTVPDATIVNIEYWNYSDVFWTQWFLVTDVSTTGSQYSYTWYPTEGGLIGIRSRWTGSSAYKAATSEVSSISISRSPTYIGVQPKELIVGSRTLPLPTPTFTINVTVKDVTDLREWKIKLKYNQTILEATEVSLPTYNVFGADYTLLEATINNTLGFVQVGARSSAASFNGSRVLCQVKFRGIGASILETAFRHDTSELEFDSGVTSLKDTPGATIIFNWEQQPASEIIVETSRRQLSVITLDVSPSQVTMGNNVGISGRITPTGAGLAANVTITYRTATMTERVLAIVKTDSNGRYSSTWSANATGTYTFKAGWDGEDLFFGASVEKTVTVVEQQVENGGPDITMYLIIAGVAAIAIVAVVVLYLVKFRKGSKTPVS